MTAEYEYNLANLIRDIRTDLEVPNLPVSIAVSGFGGWSMNEPRRLAIINSQFAMMNSTKYPEFSNNVVVVETRDYWRDELPHSPGKQGYHWNNNCESYWLIGKALANGILNIMNKSSPSSESSLLSSKKGQEALMPPSSTAITTTSPAPAVALEDQTVFSTSTLHQVEIGDGKKEEGEERIQNEDKVVNSNNNNNEPQQNRYSQQQQKEGSNFYLRKTTSNIETVAVD